MKGLYVYGALLMGMSFVVGLWRDDSMTLMLAIMACGCSALAEALTNLLEAKYEFVNQAPSAAIVAVTAIAVASWWITAFAAFFAFFAVI